MNKVVLLGFKGDGAGKHYNRVLFGLAEKRKIDLTCVDYGIPENVLGKPSLEEMEKLIKAKKVCYLDLNNPADLENYKNLSELSVVFIVTPDITHCQVAKDFLGKTKRIFIEKPLDAILRNVRILEDFPKVGKVVFGYDHYLAKFYPFQVKTDEWLKQGLIGDLREIEFRLLEPNVVPPHRLKALDRGMIYDVFPHGLSAIVATPSRFAYPDQVILKKVRLFKVQVARYFGCKTNGISFVKIDFEIPGRGRSIFCRTRVGKGVGKDFERTLRIRGSKGEIFVDIKNYKFTISDSEGKIIKQDKLLYDYEKAFLLAAIDFKKTLSQVPGALPFEAAKETLYILDEARWRSEPKGKSPIYKVGSSLSEIENKFLFLNSPKSEIKNIIKTKTEV
ncbi:Gfo/Idh/MocA family oxidoreductase [Patescibacteria group bacterium]|nr:Gfo/Idh/MocA family oxidoreductase [Patescibacteria group bacterium]